MQPQEYLSPAHTHTPPPDHMGNGFRHQGSLMKTKLGSITEWKQILTSYRQPYTVTGTPSSTAWPWTVEFSPQISVTAKHKSLSHEIYTPAPTFLKEKQESLIREGREKKALHTHYYQKNLLERDFQYKTPPEMTMLTSLQGNPCLPSTALTSMKFILTLNWMKSLFHKLYFFAWYSGPQSLQIFENSHDILLNFLSKLNAEKTNLIWFWVLLPFQSYPLKWLQIPNISLHVSGYSYYKYKLKILIW